MKIFAIGDLHLQGGDDKPMDIFGPQWTGHFERISQDWRARVAENDLVLIPGDISWAMQLSNAVPDLQSLGELPGRKILLRGNHDYWWSGINKLRDLLPHGMYAVQNDALRFEDVVVCGSRLWNLPGQQTTSEDQKIYSRELMRLEMSLQNARKLGGRIIAMTHFPPVAEDGSETLASALLSQANVSDCVYGHLHGQANKNAFCGTLNGVRYHCVSCDRLDFSLYEVPENEKSGE